MSNADELARLRALLERLEMLRRDLLWNKNMVSTELNDLRDQLIQKTKDIIAEKQEKPIEELLTPKTIARLKQLGKENEMKRKKEKSGMVAPKLVNQATESQKEQGAMDRGNAMINFEFEYYQKGTRWVTVVRITMISFESYYHTLLTGIAICNPADTFNLSTGRATAIRHAVEGLSYTQREHIWNKYHALSGTMGRIYKKPQSEKKTSS